MNITRYTNHYQKLLSSVRESLGLSYEINKNEKEEKPNSKQIELAAEKAASLSGLGNSNFVKRIHQRAIKTEVDRQDNIDNTLDKSVNYLKDNVSEEPISKDWKSNFFNKIQDISDEDVQEIWAKIFADEVANPGSISPRTLEILSNLSKNEATIFQRVLAITCNHMHLYKINSDNNFQEFNINYDNLLTLRAAGLLFEGDNLNYSYGVYYQPGLPLEVTMRHPEVLGIITLKLGNKVYQIRKTELQPGSNKYKFDAFILTPAGVELAKTMIVNFNEAYFDKLIEKIKLDGYDVNEIK